MESIYSVYDIQYGDYTYSILLYEFKTCSFFKPEDVQWQENISELFAVSCFSV